MFKDYFQNHNINIKIITIVFIQAVVIIVLISVIHIFTREELPVQVENIDSTDTSMNTNAKDFLSEYLWQVIINATPNIDKNVINDAMIREGTYEESISYLDGKKITSAKFIIDIDTLKQSYTVSMAWSDKVAYEMSIECPPKSLMKYPETECKGMTTTTASPQLYLPYKKEDDQGGAFHYWIKLNPKDSKEIIVQIYKCGYDEKKAEADAYLKSTGIELDKYKITYESFSTELPCGVTY